MMKPNYAHARRQREMAKKQKKEEKKLKKNRPHDEQSAQEEPAEVEGEAQAPEAATEGLPPTAGGDKPVA